MKKYIKNVTGDGDFPSPQVLAYIEKGKGNVAEKIKSNSKIAKIYTVPLKKSPVKFKNHVLIEAGETIETQLPNEIGTDLNDPRLVVVGEKAEKKKVE